MNVAGWPEEITLVRHGQSAGNVARDLAEKKGLTEIGINERDMDVALSELGERQAAAVGKWFNEHEAHKKYTVFLSPYKRVIDTGRLIAEEFKTGELVTRRLIDERLREREFGLVTGLTRLGILEKFPQEVESYDKIKKFYYRPPGGESWCDVILRVRSFVNMLRRDFQNQHILIVAHTVVIYAFRYVIENLQEKEILEIDRTNELANCSVTTFKKVENLEDIRLAKFNNVEHLNEFTQPITRNDDVTKI